MRAHGAKQRDGDRGSPLPIVAATYARVSTRMQGRHGFSLGNQDQTLEDYVAANGWVLPDHLRFKDGEDENASGASWDLPDLNRMLEAARRGEFQVLAVPDLDRFARTMVKGLVLEEQLKKHGVAVKYQRVPVEDSPEGQLLKTQLFAFAEYERQKTLLRTMTGRRAKAASGRVVGTGRAAYGYRFTYEALDNGRRRVRGLEPDPMTAPIARDVLRALRTASTVDVMTDLNGRNVSSPNGVRWDVKALRRMARNPVYGGTWVYGGVSVPVEGLISRDEWGELQRALDGRRWVRRGHRPVDQDPWILRGRLRCGLCRMALRTRTTSGVRYYGCPCHAPSEARAAGKPTCALPGVFAPGIEDELWRKLEATLFDPEYLGAALAAGVAEHQHADRLRTERLAAIDSETARLRKRLDAMVDEMFDLGPESREAVRRRMKEAEDLLRRYDAERVDLAAIKPEGLSPEDAADVERLAAELAAMHSALIDAGPGELRELIERLDVRGMVYAAPADNPDAVLFGRKHRFVIDWTAHIRLSNEGASFRKSRKVNCST
jgi:site-specific DNA recombinase